uniref:RCK N-terminal domain-containing protein n=1 Tax=Zooxanthella nutricula TaxID=1333877 RepID=A0A7S2VMR7_9DINO
MDESKERGTMHGRSAFGILLFQDLVVPFLLVLLPMLNAGSSGAILAAVRNAGVNALLALSPLLLGGRFLLSKMFAFVAESGNTVALRSLSFFTVLGMCYMFQVFSLSNTLGAFLAGVILSETAYRESVEIAISPIREDLLGLFFITVGFGIDLSLVLTKPVLVLSAMSGLLLCKAIVTMGVCRVSGMSFANSQHVGFLLCQAGEFAFVMFGIAREVGAFSSQQAKLLLTVTSVSMACTPLLSRVGRDFSRCLQEKKQGAGVTSSDIMGEVREKLEGARVIICGYGRVGVLVTQLLDTKFIPWVAFDVDDRIVAEARGKDLPVFLGDIPEIAARAMNGKDAACLDAKKVAVVTPSDAVGSLHMVRNLRQAYPDLRIVARAMTESSARSLRGFKAEPIVPGLPEDTILMNLPIGATVLKALGCPEKDAEAVVNNIRQELLVSEGQAKLKSGALYNLVKWYHGEREQQQADAAERAAEEVANSPPQAVAGASAEPAPA